MLLSDFVNELTPSTYLNAEVKLKMLKNITRLIDEFGCNVPDLQSFLSPHFDLSITNPRVMLKLLQRFFVLKSYGTFREMRQTKILLPINVDYIKNEEGKKCREELNTEFINRFEAVCNVIITDISPTQQLTVDLEFYWLTTQRKIMWFSPLLLQMSLEVERGVYRVVSYDDLIKESERFHGTDKKESESSKENES